MPSVPARPLVGALLLAPLLALGAPAALAQPALTVEHGLERIAGAVPAPLPASVTAARPSPSTDGDDRPVDPLTRALRLTVGGAVLLGLLGVGGLYLTREHR